jgi:uncharacterized protein with HEPN domain
MSRRTAELLLADIREAIEKIDRYTGGLSLDGFMADEKTQDAVVRNLEIIGEAANRLPQEFKVRRADIEWPKIVGRDTGSYTTTSVSEDHLAYHQ